MRTFAIIVAGGAGTRMRAPTPKQFVDILGKPLLAHTLERFERCEVIDGIVLVLPRDGFAQHQMSMSRWVTTSKPVPMVPGGPERQDSVANGLSALPADFRGWVAVHDGVRPLVPVDVIRNVVEAARRFGGALAALPVQETLKEVGERDRVKATIDRRALYRAQTPQCFRYEILRAAIDQARADGFLGTDESALVERVGGEVHIVPGSEENIKVTTPRDLALATYVLRMEADSCGSA